MKKIMALITGLVLFSTVCLAQAGLTTIGTVTYGGSDYNLIWDKNNNGNSVVWLDYSNGNLDWSAQSAWAAGLGEQLSNINTPGYSITWTDQAWRLPNMVDGPLVFGYEGDPDHDGIYTYAVGYNLANSEMGYLYYTEFDNLGFYANDGSHPQSGWGLENTGVFENLIGSVYWSGTECVVDSTGVWFFNLSNGIQNVGNTDAGMYGLALRGGTVSAVPIPAAIYMLGSGLIGLVSLRKRKQCNRV